MVYSSICWFLTNLNRRIIPAQPVILSPFNMPSLSFYPHSISPLYPNYVPFLSSFLPFFCWWHIVLGLSQNRLPSRPISHHHSYHTYCQNLRHPLIFLDNPQNKYLTISNYIPVHPINPVIACYTCILFQYIPFILPRDIPIKHLIWITYLHYMGISWNAGYPFIAGWFISWNIPI